GFHLCGPKSREADFVQGEAFDKQLARTVAECVERAGCVFVKVSGEIGHRSNGRLAHVPASGVARLTLGGLRFPVRRNRYRLACRLAESITGEEENRNQDRDGGSQAEPSWQEHDRKRGCILKISRKQHARSTRGHTGRSSRAVFRRADLPSGWTRDSQDCPAWLLPPTGCQARLRKSTLQ